MRVALADGAIPSVDEEFASLVPGDAPRPVDSLLLGFMDQGTVLTPRKA